jgi:hypothetical protein
MRILRLSQTVSCSFWPENSIERMQTIQINDEDISPVKQLHLEIHIKSNQIQSNQIKSNPIKSNQINQTTHQIHPHEMRTEWIKCW